MMSKLECFVFGVTITLPLNLILALIIAKCIGYCEKGRDDVEL